jgi:hypothetical protein
MHSIFRDWSFGLVGALRFGVVLPPWDASWSLLVRVSAQSQLAWVGRNWGCARERVDDRTAGHQFLVGRHDSRRSHGTHSLIQYQTWSFADTRTTRGYLYEALSDEQSQLDHIRADQDQVRLRTTSGRMPVRPIPIGRLTYMLMRMSLDAAAWISLDAPAHIHMTTCDALEWGDPKIFTTPKLTQRSQARPLENRRMATGSRYLGRYVLAPDGTRSNEIHTSHLT